jgi:hypothetical protein
MAEPTELNDYQRQQRYIQDFYTGYQPPEKDSYHAIALRWSTIVEGQDEEGYYDSTPIEVDTAAVMSALLDALPTDEDNPYEQTPSFTMEVDGVTVKVEWNAAWRIPDRHMM